MLRRADGRRVEGKLASSSQRACSSEAALFLLSHPRCGLWIESHALSMPASRVSGEGCITICRSRKSELVCTYINVFWTLIKCVYRPWSETRSVCAYVCPCMCGCRVHRRALVNCCAHCMHGCMSMHTCVRSGCELSRQNCFGDSTDCDLEPVSRVTCHRLPWMNESLLSGAHSSLFKGQSMTGFLPVPHGPAQQPRLTAQPEDQLRPGGSTLKIFQAQCGRRGSRRKTLDRLAWQVHSTPGGNGCFSPALLP